VKLNADKRTYDDGTTVWTTRLELPPDPITGKRRQRRIQAPTKKALEALAITTLNELQTGTYIEPTTVTVSEYLDHWLKTSAVHNVRATTYRSYEQMIRVHMKPILGHLKLQKLQPAQLQALYSEKLSAGRADGKGGLSMRTVRYLHMIVRQALDQAVKWRLILHNPADATEPPRPGRTTVAAWDTKHALRFLEASAGDAFAPLWLLALSTGMRRGELLGLRWQDVDLPRATLHVRQSLVEVGGRLVFQQPKTASGRRGVSLPPAAVDALKSHRARQNERRLGLGEVWRDHDLVFTVADGGPVTPANLLRSFRRLLERVDVPDIRFHDLRHTHATLLLKDGTHAKIVSERLGHASIAITLDTYSHVLPDMQQQAAESIERALFATHPNSA
jgi:integrase